ncbi:MAG: hypothetical protein ACLFVE_09010 [Chitinispirillaceae bacterium]
MKVGIVICTDDRSTCFPAIRCATFHMMENSEVTIYFVGSGFEFDKGNDSEYGLCRMLADFRKTGGKCIVSRDREILENRLSEQFKGLVQSKQIEKISHDDKIRSIMTKDVLIRKFIEDSCDSS